jgi:hypothetical protein
MKNNNIGGGTSGLNIAGTQLQASDIAQVLKYSSEISAIPECAADAAATFSESAYRAVHEGAPATDFLPHGRLNSARFQGKNAGECCKSWALSMFESPEQMKKRFLQIEKTVPNYRLIPGEYCARLKLTSAHGKRTAADKKGHFSFFEYEHFDGKAVVDKITPLFP